MRYPVELPGFENRQLAVAVIGTVAKLLIDGAPAPKGFKRGHFTLRRNDGVEVAAKFRGSIFFDPIPQLVVDGRPVALVPPLKWYQWLWGMLPLSFILVGGGLGGMCGAVATVVNGWLLRSGLNGIAKYLATGLVTLAALAFSLVAAVAFNPTLFGIMAGAPQEFKSEAGGFSIMTPAALKESVQTEDTEAGRIDTHLFMASQGAMTFMVGYADFPPALVQQADPDIMLDGGRDGVVKNVNGELVSENKIALAGHPGREFVIKANDENGGAVAIKGRFFMVANRIYEIMVGAPASQGVGKSGDDFLQSFKLLP